MVSGFGDSVGGGFLGAGVMCWNRERDDEVEREKSEMGDRGCEGFLGWLRRVWGLVLGNEEDKNARKRKNEREGFNTRTGFSAETVF